jgi:hypothetical protein
VRVKTAADRGGLVTAVVYRNVCMIGVKELIVIDPNYSGGGSVPSCSFLSFPAL